jgi:Sulfatase
MALKMQTIEKAVRLFVAVSIALTVQAEEPLAISRPNIVVLFADNLGYSDIGFFGSPTARTPNVDSLGRQGIKLNNWNSAAHLCSASRAALLTGKYPVRTGIYPGVFEPDAAYGMLPTETTLAEYLKEYGYATSIVGKWHLGHQAKFLPTNQGFDSWLGLPYHASGGSIDDHICHNDRTETLWLPLFDGEQIVQQPVRMQDVPWQRNRPFFSTWHFRMCINSVHQETTRSNQAVSGVLQV